MPEANRPDPRRRPAADARSKKAPASRPGKSGDVGRAKPRASSSPRRDVRSIEARPGREIARVREAPDEPAVPDGSDPAVGDSIRDSIAAAAERASEQRFGSAARRAAILAAVICVLTLTIAGPVRTYFAQRTEMKQLEASEAQLREQIAELEEQKDKLGDPVFIAAQARERLGFVMPGEIPYQVQLPPGAAVPGAPTEELAEVNSGDPWYTALWHTIAEVPQGIPPTAPPSPPGAPGAPEPVAPGAPPPGG
ncbi:septum formation initiator family protein [Mycolicibacterium hippocampi]|uniref:Cell division protein DivIC (FtsB), stabilizes FtsL against RasP cleavage n=1 Tax=Mycolicibacterium hippocampi TaxID=659824 RepID=A0A850PX77_9MYCO|nr:Cell division protein DivIC (FtsB), stabilizes FtsL against RasP cleavage [Mycolicibacterium hippocampi]